MKDSLVIFFNHKSKMTHRHHIDTVLSLISPTRNPVPKEGLTIFGVKKESKIIWRRRFCLYFRQNPGGTEKGPRPHPTHNPLRFQTELGVPNRLSWVGSRSIVEFLTALNNNLFHLFNLSCLFHKWFEYQGKKKTREKKEMVFCYQNCSDLLWEKIVCLIEKNIQNFWDH